MTRRPSYGSGLALLGLATLAVAAAWATEPAATYFGVCAVVKSFLPPEANQRRADLIKAAGIDFVRTDFTWRVIEAQPGGYSFEKHDAMVALAEANDLALLGLISHTPAWAAPITDHLDAWLAFVTATVTRYPQIRYWEVFNEPNLESFWGSKPDAAGYAELLKRTYAAIKGIDPTLYVVSAGLAGGNNAGGGYAAAYAEAMFAHGLAGSFDAFGIHPYRWPHAPEEFRYEANTKTPEKQTLEVTLGKYRALMAAHGCGEKPLWITECGYTAMPGPGLLNRGVTEAEQADFLPRSILLAFQYGAANWMWFTTQSQEQQPDDKEHWFGILHPDFTPRLAYHALQTLRRAYPPGSALIQERHLKEPVYRLAWRRPDGLTGWALWIIERGVEQPCELRVTGQVIEAFDALGKSIELKVDDGRSTVTLSGRMLFVIGPDKVEAAP